MMKLPARGALEVIFSGATAEIVDLVVFDFAIRMLLEVTPVILLNSFTVYTNLVASLASAV